MSCVTAGRAARSWAWADIDIDKAAGFKHGLEVIGNAVLNNRTNPYAVRELLLATDPIDHTLDPGYQFRF